LHFTLWSQDRVLGAAIGLSIALHAALLSMHFKFPDTLRWKAPDHSLEVVLVNAKSKERPAKADALAQANLSHGGTVEDDRRAKTPLPVTEPRKPGKDLAEAQRRQRALEAQQAELLAKAREAQTRVPASAQRQPEVDNPASQPNGRDLADLSLAAMRLQAQIDRQIQEYQKRPRKKFIGANVSEYRFAQYEEDWRVKVERIGTLNYPAEARGRSTATCGSPSPSGPGRQCRIGRARPLLGPQGARCGGVQDPCAWRTVRRVPARHPARHRSLGHHADVVLRPGRQDLD
jgi:protein TonB